MEIIHIVLGKANPDRMNGVNKVVHQLASEQDLAGKNIQVWGITQNHVHDYPERNFKTVLFGHSIFSFSIPRVLKHAILNHRSAVFHLHGGWIPVFSSLATFFRRHNIKFVLTPHGAYNEVAMQKSYYLKKIYFQLFEKNIIEAVHKVHSIGASEVKGLSKMAPNTKSFLLPYGFDACYIQNKSIISDAFIVGFVGRLDVHTKGLDLLLESFKNFQKTTVHAQLWIIGDGSGRIYIENYIKENKLESVILWGKKFGTEKDELMSRMHVFAHPSRNEGLPTSVLEAAVMGIPTIVSQATNVASYVSKYNAGISIADNHPSQLTDAIHHLYKSYENHENKMYSDGARKMMEEVFAWSVLIDQYDELYL